MLYGYKALLQVAALVFSFSIRKVKVKGVNDAKYVAAAVYVTSIVTAVIFVSLYSLKAFVNLYAALFSLGFFIGTSVILVLVFIPKVMEIHACDDQFEIIRSKANISSSLYWSLQCATHDKINGTRSNCCHCRQGDSLINTKVDRLCFLMLLSTMKMP